MLCHYKNSLGIPGKGIHKHVFGIAIVDVIMTILGAYVLSKVLPFKFTFILIFLFLLGIILHHLFCVKTTVDKILSL